MTPRDLAIAIVRHAVSGRPIAEVQVYVDHHPAQVKEGAQDFCKHYRMGRWVYELLVANDVSVAHELYVFIEESKQAAVQSKGVEAPGEPTNVKP